MALIVDCLIIYNNADRQREKIKDKGISIEGRKSVSFFLSFFLFFSENENISLSLSLTTLLFNNNKLLY
jgi:hypothetical protein